MPKQEPTPKSYQALYDAIDSVTPSFRKYGDEPADEQTVELRNLREALEDAQQNLERFENSNPVLLKLKQAVEKAEMAYNRAFKRFKQNIEKESRKVRNLLRLKGSSPQTIAAVEAFLKKWQDK